MPKIQNLVRRAGNASSVRIVAALIVIAVVATGSWAWLSEGEPGQTQLDLTLEELEAAVIRDPQDSDARLAVAIGYAARGFSDNAIKQFKEVLSVEAENQTALMGLGRVYHAEDRLEEAVELFMIVVELNVDNPLRGTLEQLERVYYDLGAIYSSWNDFGQASVYLEEALLINPVDADAWYSLGGVQKKDENWEAALHSYSRAIRLVPNYVEVYTSMADIYSQTGKTGEEKYATGMIKLAEFSFDKAIEDLTTATLEAPNLAEAHEGLGLALESKGRVDEALASYHRALQLDPTLILAQSAVQRLASP